MCLAGGPSDAQHPIVLPQFNANHFRRSNLSASTRNLNRNKWRRGFRRYLGLLRQGRGTPFLGIADPLVDHVIVEIVHSCDSSNGYPWLAARLDNLGFKFRPVSTVTTRRWRDERVVHVSKQK